MIEFKNLGLTPSLANHLKKIGFHTPTPIQTKIIPLIIAGRDIIGTAQTGTGKTAAFTLPLLNATIGTDLPQRCTTHALILTPTRELAAQILESIKTCGKHLKYNAALIIGGVPHVPQKRTLEKGQDIIVATPGRLEEYISSNFIDMSQIKTLVIDEADQMLDMGFFPMISRIAQACPNDKQVVFLSATMPKKIRVLAKEMLNNPVHVEIGREAKPIATTEQKVIFIPSSQKRDKVYALLSDPQVKTAIVFTRQKQSAEQEAYHLAQAGISTGVLHGDKPQKERNSVMNNFRGGKFKALVATDIAARGLDIPNVSLVINFDLPTLAEIYVHRIGRTGRAGAEGKAISLCDHKEKNLLKAIEETIGMKFNKNGKPEYSKFSEDRRNRIFNTQHKAHINKKNIGNHKQVNKKKYVLDK